MDVLELICNTGLVAEASGALSAHGADVMKTLAAGGIRVLEVSSPEEAAALAPTAAQADMAVGVDGVRTLAACEQGLAAGASFLISSAFRPELLAWGKAHSMPVIPTCVTPTEIEGALDAGVTLVRYAPVSAYGGSAACAVLGRRYRKEHLRFLVGDAPESALGDVFTPACVAAAEGPWIDLEAAAQGNIAAIQDRTLALTRTQLGLGFIHMGINQPDPEHCRSVAALYADLFQLPLVPCHFSDFAGSLIEVTKGSALGTHGHIGIVTHSLRRAIWFFEQKGYHMDHETDRIDGEGRLFAVYFKEEFGGFAVHLLEK